MLTVRAVQPHVLILCIAARAESYSAHAIFSHFLVDKVTVSFAVPACIFKGVQDGLQMPGNWSSKLRTHVSRKHGVFQVPHDARHKTCHGPVTSLIQADA